MADAGIAVEQRQQESKGFFIQRSNQEIGGFLDELRKEGVTISSEDNKVERCAYNEYGTGPIYGHRVVNLEFVTSRHGEHYFLNMETIVAEGRRERDEQNNIMDETFIIEPKKLIYIRKQRPIHSKAYTAEEIEVNESFFFQRGTIDEARAIHDKLLSALSRARKAIDTWPEFNLLARDKRYTPTY